MLIAISIAETPVYNLAIKFTHPLKDAEFQKLFLHDQKMMIVKFS